MKLATLNNQTRDGFLVVVNKKLTHYADASHIAPTMQQALDSWHQVKNSLEELAADLEKQKITSEPFLVQNALAPLPRAYQWLDGSAYLNHVELVRKARGAVMPPEFLEDPLMYQGGSDTMLSATADIEVSSEDYGIDLEAEIAVITDDVSMATPAEKAGEHICLLTILNDVSLRSLIPTELAKGFGFMQSKPPTAFSPVFVTPDELGEAWQNDKIHLPLRTWINNEWFGSPNAGVDMQFNFAQLVAHAAKTRPLGAGSIIGSGTISNKDSSQGFCCLAETRMIETIESGKPNTPFLSFGDTVKIEMTDTQGNNIFGTIEQKVVRKNNNDR